MSPRALFRLAIFLFVLVLIDLYAWRGISNAIAGWPQTGRRWVRLVYWAISIGMVGMLVWLVVSFQDLRGTRNHSFVFSFIALLLLFLLPKLVIIVFHGLDDLLHLFRWGWWKLTPAGEAAGEVLT